MNGLSKRARPVSWMPQNKMADFYFVTEEESSASLFFRRQTMHTMNPLTPKILFDKV